MSGYEIIDALTGDQISFSYESGDASIVRGVSDPVQASVTSLFFPGCSFINYAMPLVQAVYDLLLKAGEVQGISVLCCGKILSYEPNGVELRDAFEADLRDHLATAGIQRMVCACPNCVKALREALELDPRTKDIEIAVLPEVLAGIGYQLDPQTCARLIKGNPEDDVLLCTHDSCPDREYGQFADGLRALMPDGLWVDPAHTRSRSICCGSLPRAAGKFEQADKCAQINGKEAQEVQADAIVTACMSCTFQLNMAQPYIQCVNYLELLFDWRVDWSTVGAWMKLRFLFDETLGATDAGCDDRAFAGLGGSCSAVDEGDATIADAEARERDAEGSITAKDFVAATDVGFSNANVVSLGEEGSN